MLATDHNKQILIVDQDVASVEPLRQKLGEAGFVVRAITDGTAAVTAVAERPPHLVIIDWNMPGLSALQVIQGVRRARSLTGTSRARGFPARAITISSPATARSSNDDNLAFASAILI